MAKLGLVTVLYNSNEVLEGFFESLNRQTLKDFTLYIIDNTPSAQTDEILADLIQKHPMPGYVHVKNAGNVGVAKGNNQGIEFSIADGCQFTLLLNNDIEFDQTGLLRDLVDIAEKRNENLIVPKIMFYGEKKIWMAGGMINFWLGVTSHIGYKCADADVYNHETYVSYAPTCFMLIDNTVFKEVGMMDEQYFVYYDDTDFVFRALKHGYKLLFVPQFLIFHKVSSSTGGEESEFSFYYMLRNRILFLRKNFKGLRFLLGFGYCFLSSVYRYIKIPKFRKTIVSAFSAGVSLKIK